MNKFMDLEEAEQPAFKDVFREIERLHITSQGAIFKFYWEYKCLYFGIDTPARHWEYPWAVINSQVSKGDRVLDAGCGGSPLLLYLYKMGCLCYGIDYKFYSPETLSSKIKFQVAMLLRRIYPFNLWLNIHQLEGLSNPAKALGFGISYIKGDLTNIPVHDNNFDRIFCISVIEHLSEEDMLKTAKELSRVLRPRGLLVMTIDCWGTGLMWQDFIKASGLSLYGETDFSASPRGKYAYDVVGFVLIKQ